jgi:cytochrome c nitrite reductase small subunit
VEPSDPVVEPAKPATPRRRKLTRFGILAIAMAILVGMLGGLGGFTFGYGKGYSYLSNNPAACANCHVMQDAYDAWQKSSHHNVATCGDCHLPHDFIGHWLVEADNGTFHSIAFTTGDFHEPIQIKARNRRVTQNACIHCHQDTVDQMLPAAQTGEMLNCIQCHNDVGHAGRRRGSVGANPREP